MIDSILQIIQKFATYVVNLLPVSPFRSFIDNFQAPEYLGWIAWFFPVSQALQILAAWLHAIGLFYLYSIIARWAKVIGD